MHVCKGGQVLPLAPRKTGWAAVGDLGKGMRQYMAPF